MSTINEATDLTLAEHRAEALIRHYSRATNLFVAHRSFGVTVSLPNPANPEAPPEITEDTAALHLSILQAALVRQLRGLGALAHPLALDPTRTLAVEVSLDVLFHLHGALPIPEAALNPTLTQKRERPLVIVPSPESDLSAWETRMSKPHASQPRRGVMQNENIILVQPFSDWPAWGKTPSSVRPRSDRSTSRPFGHESHEYRRPITQ